MPRKGRYQGRKQPRQRKPPQFRPRYGYNSHDRDGVTTYFIVVADDPEHRNEWRTIASSRDPVFTEELVKRLNKDPIHTEGDDPRYDEPDDI